MAVAETILWDDAWYDDPEYFAADFEELGGDPGDAKALAAFVEDRLMEDFRAFLAATEPALADAAALMVHATTPTVEPFDLQPGLPRTFDEALTDTAMANELAMCSRIRVSDLRGALCVAGTAPSGREVSYELRELSPEQLRAVEDICLGRDREGSLAGVWSRARDPRIASTVLEDRSRAVAPEVALASPRREERAREALRDEVGQEPGVAR